jgi:pyruvate ferredoxin oxidoreductase delta subunit
MAKKAPEELTWRDLEIGYAVTEPGSASEYRSGDWRSRKPVWDFAKCIKCGLCYTYCPDAAIYQRDDGYFEANLYYCKGCSICTQECPTTAIHMVEEGE